LKKLLIASFIGVSILASGSIAEDCIMVEDLNVQFKNASTTYSNKEQQKEIKKFADFMKKTDLYAIIEGHTSSRSLARFNYDLSTQRANKVAFALKKLGVEKHHIRSMGFGESKPLFDNSTKEGAMKNRRVIAEVFNTAKELDTYIKSEKKRIKPILFIEQ